ncbi:neuropilin-2b isoform X2 [Myxocyprinus asiaticus]|uniref:neuropilin-2b isoform X2 n=1 Tax=Myxocyprinus asiaticus TaxID=70543 RepID=UPI0022238490|nr:neuropilin-2b isoform X2 [Myxocyprinus asiaticus]
MDLFTKLCGSLLVLCLSALVYGEEEACGGHLDASDAGYITTPGYPLEYPPHQNCRWVITAPEPSQRIVLNFNPHFELEKLDCRYDFIEIRDGNSETADLLGRHCSNIAPPAIISSGPVLHIKFVSDYAHQGAGFSLRYEIYKTGSDCSRNFTSPSGVIESPGFPDKYPHNLECTFIIIVPTNMDVTLTFLTFDLENDPLQGSEGECKYDWLEVWDGLPQVGPLIGRHCGTKIPAEIQSSTGILSLSFHTDMAVAKDGFSARYNMTLKEVNDNFHCSNAFGMESSKISDDQISASSSFYDGRWSPRQARLNFDDNAWTPNEDSNKEYIQVDLHFLKVLTGIATQGAVSKETHKSYFVTTFKLEVSTNGEDWMIYRFGKNHKVFHANVDPSEVVLNRVPQPVLARFVRIRPQTWKNGIALRFELYGCQITDAPCSEMQGMLSGLLPDSQISASSMRDIHGATGAARLVASRSGWFPSPTQPVAGEEWLQVDLGVPKTVRGIITQGARGVDGSTSAENRAFVRKYRLSHSLNGKDWSYIIDPKTSLPKLFEGNTHYDTPEIRRFDEIVAQFIRVYPERWSPAGIGMRLEILGCDLPESTTIPDTARPTLPLQEETSTAYRTPAPTTVSSLGGLCNFELSMCGWTHDPMSDLNWSLYSSSSPSLDLTLGSDNFGNFLYVEASPKTEPQHARLVSPSVGPEHRPVCLLFYYQLQGEGQDSLRVLLRDDDQEETLLWTLKGDQGPMWREGRTILPQSPKQYQVVIEGFFERGSRGHIWVDNIHMSSNTELEQCTQPFAAFPPEMTGGDLPGWSEPTVDTTVSLQPMPTYWYYVIAGGGALFLLGCVTLVMVLCCYRYHLAAKKSQHSVSYQSTGTGQYVGNGPGGLTGSGVEPMLTIRDFDYTQSCKRAESESFVNLPSISQCSSAWIAEFATRKRRPEDLGNNPLFHGRERTGQGFPFPVWTTANPSREPPVTRLSEKDNAWLYTLDPILVTIIVMSSLGVLLGAVCAGLLLYCTCSYNGLSSRSTTTLENYNFELYDGIKHKVKINQQRYCSEA